MILKDWTQQKPGFNWKNMVKNLRDWIGVQIQFWNNLQLVKWKWVREFYGQIIWCFKFLLGKKNWGKTNASFKKSSKIQLVSPSKRCTSQNYKTNWITGHLSVPQNSKVNNIIFSVIVGIFGHTLWQLKNHLLTFVTTFFSLVVLFFFIFPHWS